MSLRRHLPVLLIALVGLLATAGAWRLAHSHERSVANARYRNSFEQAANHAFLALERELATQTEVVPGVVAFFDSSEAVHEDEFWSFAEKSVQRHAGLVALEWAPRVTQEEVPAFGELTRTMGWADPGIRELRPDGTTQPASPRGVYFPVLYIAPKVGNEAALGLDLYGQAERRDALQRAVETGELQATEPIRLVQGSGATNAVLLASAVYQRGSRPETAEERAAMLRGFVVGVLRLDLLAHRALAAPQFADTTVDGVNVYFYAGGKGSMERQPLHVQGARDQPSQPAALPLSQALSGLHASHRLSLGGSSWVVVARPQVPGVTTPPSALSWTVLLAGLALTGAGIVTVLVLISRNEMIEALVSARTTELGKTTEELVRRERQLRALVDNVADGILTVDGHGLIRSVNRSTEVMFGRPASSLINMPLSEIVPEDRSGTRLDDTGGVLAQVEAEAVERTGRRADNSLFPVEFTLRELGALDSSLYLVVLRDLSQDRAVDRMKDQFISTVSHELRTPLTAVLGSLELIRDGMVGELPEQAQRMVELAHENGDRLVRLINDILDLEGLGTGQMTLQVEEVDAGKLVEHAVRIHKGLAERYGVELATDIPPGAHWVHADRGRILQVFANLIGNAVKFSPQGGRVEVAITPTPGRVLFSVEDQGPGIPEAFHGMVFAPFSQADSSDRRRWGGTGLGLSIAKAIVEAHGGTISFKTNQERGTVFTFSLPTSDQAEPGIRVS